MLYYVCLKSCDSGWCTDTGDLPCVPCPAQCLTCIMTTRCTSCQDGYYLLSEACLPCPAGCVNCTFDAALGQPTCLLCDSSFYVTGGNCFLCSSAIPSCLNCTSATYCLACADTAMAYSATDNSCVLCG
jgi:proprotein convertase subtilisin/kexin type 5